MRIAKVAVDMSSEQKNIQGVVSSRQAIYLGVGGIILYSYIPIVFNLLFEITGWLPAIICCLVLASPVIFVVGFFGFTKVSKYNMNRDYFYFIKFQRKTQYGSWRKGM